MNASQVAPKFFTMAVDSATRTERYSDTCSVTGAEWIKRLAPESFPLWLYVSQLERGGTLQWSGHHGDEVVYVIDGELESDGSPCGTGGTVVIESGATATVQARRSTTIAHFGPLDRTPPGDGPFGLPQSDGHSVHVVSQEGIFSSPPGEEPGWLFYADSHCPTCRVNFFRITHPMDHGNPQHSHSQSEIIFVLAGGVFFGRNRYGAGSAIGIVADTRYRFRTAPDEGLVFVNYRRDSGFTTIFGPDGKASQPLSEDVRTTRQNFDGFVKVSAHTDVAGVINTAGVSVDV
jgi:quercetin dioxygenase-like cupin family protein